MPEYKHRENMEDWFANARAQYRLIRPTGEVLATWNELPGVHSTPPLVREEHAVAWQGRKYITPPWILQRYVPPPEKPAWRRVDYRT